MNILLIHIGGKKYPYPPYGLLYISINLKNNNNIKIIHEDNYSLILKNNKNIIKDADLIGFSVITSPYLKDIITLSKLIKHNYNKKILWGGPHPTMVPEIVLKEKYVDYIVLGEGEERFNYYLSSFISGNFPNNLDGIGFKKNGKLFIFPPRQFIDCLDKYEIDWSQINLKDYIFHISDLGKGFCFITSRGCFHRCGFCYNNFCYKNNWKAHSVSYVIDHINYLKKQGINYIEFLDDNFFGDEKRAFDIVYKINVPWSAQVHPNQLNKDFIKKCKETQCIWLYLGIESGSQRILRIINKNISIPKLIDNLRLLTDYKIKVVCSFIIGFPTETSDDLKATLKLIKTLGSISEYIRIHGPKIYTPYPGTPLYKRFFVNNINMPKTNLEYAFYPTRFNYDKVTWFSKDKIHILKKYFLSARLLGLKKPVSFSYSAY